MFTAADLLDLHRRTHRSLERFLGHCEGFPPDALARPLDGFGYPTLLLQVHHVLGAERYWFGVLEGRLLVDEDEADHASLGALRAFRDQVVAATRDYLGRATEQELGTRREVLTWGGRRTALVPAHVVLRTQTHVFQHLGQGSAMCRLLGRPVPPGLDFPLGDDV